MLLYKKKERELMTDPNQNVISDQTIEEILDGKDVKLPE
jgi:hypothetical protein